MIPLDDENLEYKRANDEANKLRTRKSSGEETAQQILDLHFKICWLNIQTPFKRSEIRDAIISKHCPSKIAEQIESKKDVSNRYMPFSLNETQSKLLNDCPEYDKIKQMLLEEAKRDINKFFQEDPDQVKALRKAGVLPKGYKTNEEGRTDTPVPVLADPPLLRFMEVECPAEVWKGRRIVQIQELEAALKKATDTVNAGQPAPVIATISSRSAGEPMPGEIFNQEAQDTLYVRVPDGVEPGQTFHVRFTGVTCHVVKRNAALGHAAYCARPWDGMQIPGSTVKVPVPDGVRPGQTFYVQVPYHLPEMWGQYSTSTW